MEMQADEKPATRSESVLPVYVSSVPIETDIKKKKKMKKDKGPEIPSENLFPELISLAAFPELELKITLSNR